MTQARKYKTEDGKEASKVRFTAICAVPITEYAYGTIFALDQAGQLWVKLLGAPNEPGWIACEMPVRQRTDVRSAEPAPLETGTERKRVRQEPAELLDRRSAG